jgi:hypothetical protein
VGGRPMRFLIGVGCIAGIFIAGSAPLLAQSQSLAVRYSASQLNCARFVEAAHSKIRTESGGRGREQTSGRRGVWEFRAVSSADEVALEGWLDSLALWRRSAETRVSPDTDGLLGGRYRGTLNGDGTYISRARPFVPDEVAEVAGMGTALDDFFPPLSPRALAPGQAWTDSLGLTIRRLPDSALSGVLLYRFELESHREVRSAAMPSDTLPLKLRQRSQERGTFIWHPSLGLLRRDRTIVVETTVPASRSIRQAVRSRIEQRITVVRDLTVSPDTSGRCGVVSS